MLCLTELELAHVFSGLESGRYQRLYPYKNQLLRSSWASGTYMLLHAVCMPEVKRSGGVRQCTHDLDDFFCEFCLKLQTGHFGLLSFLLWARTRKEFNRDACIACLAILLLL